MENLYDSIVLKADREVYFEISSTDLGKIIITAKPKSHLKPKPISTSVLGAHELYGKHL